MKIGDALELTRNNFNVEFDCTPNNNRKFDFPGGKDGTVALLSDIPTSSGGGAKKVIFITTSGILTLNKTHENSCIVCENTANLTIRVPSEFNDAGLDIAIELGEIDIVQANTGNVFLTRVDGALTFIGEGSDSVTSWTIIGKGSAASLKKLRANYWFIGGGIYY